MYFFHRSVFSGVGPLFNLFLRKFSILYLLIFLLNIINKCIVNFRNNKFDKVNDGQIPETTKRSKNYIKSVSVPGRTLATLVFPCNRLVTVSALSDKLAVVFRLLHQFVGFIVMPWTWRLPYWRIDCQAQRVTSARVVRRSALSPLTFFRRCKDH